MEQVEERWTTLTQTVEPRYRNGSIEVTPKPALDAAGIPAGSSLFFQANGDDLVAIAVDRKVDGRSYPDASPIQQRGRFMIPSTYHEVLGLDPETVQQGESPRLAVYADDGILVFQPVTELAVSVDWGEVPG